ncbi:hypothetical protein NKF26_12110 [Haladaptatus sp. AB618]|uniref:hypothetical protein n=1 Tax=Haladaptatus sp. AB618 TaxID=2934173 RepID=UPI00209C0688|nr:hypothetical protein [Haladaptatus sp. AB618]MCO8254547.1 hypothetical protein [Haladaptatus sp. AB618]
MSFLGNAIGASMLGGYLAYIVGFLAVFLLAYWTFDERDQTETWGDTIERVGERSTSATGGLIGAAGSLTVVLIALVSTIGTQLTESGMRIVELISTDPVLSGGVATGLTGVFNNAGIVSLSTVQLLGIVAVFLIAGTIWRERVQT